MTQAASEKRVRAALRDAIVTALSLEIEGHLALPVRLDVLDELLDHYMPALPPEDPSIPDPEPFVCTWGRAVRFLPIVVRADEGREVRVDTDGASRVRLIVQQGPEFLDCWLSPEKAREVASALNDGAEDVDPTAPEIENGWR